MLLYHDPERTEDPESLILKLLNQIRSADRFAKDQRTDFLIVSGEWMQGVLDFEFQANAQVDELTPLHRAAAQLNHTAAKFYLAPTDETVFELESQLQKIRNLPLPEKIRIHIPEGYAFYGLFPETFAESARNWRKENREPLVVLGIRSIGTSLGAVVSVAAESAWPAWTLRPYGDPFHRRLRLGNEFETFLLALPHNIQFGIVDEGPGMTGGSFGCVADWLEDHGIDRKRLHFFSSHSRELGPHSQLRHRTRWMERPTNCTDFHWNLLARPISFGDSEKIRDVSAGRWRALKYDPKHYPPSFLEQEKLKFLLSEEKASEKKILASFIGLGTYGEKKFRRAIKLSEAGFTPKVLSFQNGFLFQEWKSDAKILSLERDRRKLLDFLLRYFRLLKSIPVDSTPAISAPEQFEQSIRNLSEMQNPNELDLITRPLRSSLKSIQDNSQPIATDNRLQIWEWLKLPDGSLLKCDAVDHFFTHTYIGLQDLRWDLAGAQIELSLTPSEIDHLANELTVEFTREREFYIFNYLAYQIAYYGVASEITRSLDELESQRLKQRQAFYRKSFDREFGEPKRGWLPRSRRNLSLSF